MSSGNFSDTTPAAPAGVVNIKFQSDASGNISAYSPVGSWQAWTPTVTASGSMTISGLSVLVAQYLRIGPIICLEAQCAFTLGGTASSSVLFTLPVSVIGTQHASLYAILAMNAGAAQVGLATFPNTTQLSVFLNGQGNWTLGSGAQFQVTGFYRCA
jgi:hypothetical protein